MPLDYKLPVDRSCWLGVRSLMRRGWSALFQRDGFRAWLTLSGLLALATLVLNTWVAFVDRGLFLAHDEAEHLHVVFALDRGEIPYRDFIENHPVLAHLGLLWLKNLLGLGEVIDVYLWARGVVALHFVGCVVLLVWSVALFVDRERSFVKAACSVAIALCLLGIWSDTSEWYWGLGILWQLRPDWVYTFFAALSVLLHARWLQQKNEKSLWPLVIAGAAGGLATSILAKSIYLFLPYAVTLVVIAAEWLRRDARNARESILRIVGPNVLYLAVGIVTFAGLVGIELNASGASLQEYWHANFVLNSSKHMPLGSDDFNAANVIRGLLGVNLLGAFGIAAFAYFRLIRPQRREVLTETAVVVFCVLTVLINAILPAFSNGVTWPHYFIPTILAAVIFFADFLRCLARWRDPQGVTLFPAIAGQTIVLVFAGLLILLAGRFGAALDRTEGVRHQEEVRRAFNGSGISPAGFQPDRLLPSDLDYLVFEPHSKPANARAWGYYFMLSPDRHFWIDNHRLGLGPDPAAHWQVQFSKKAPDVIMLRDYEDFLRRRFVLNVQQSIQIAWLWQIVERDYVCMIRNPLKIQVSRQLTARFDLAGWQRCSPERNDSDHGPHGTVGANSG